MSIGKKISLIYKRVKASDVSEPPSFWSIAGLTIALTFILDVSVDLPIALAIDPSSIGLEIAKSVVFAIGFGLAMALLTRRTLRSHWQRINHLVDLTRRDHQTKLLNHNAFMEEVEKVLRKDRSALLLIGDIDRFKTINDTFGHQVGDRVILSVGAIISDLFGHCARTGRIGGEEFGVVMALPFADRLAAYHASMAFAQEWRKRIEAMKVDGVGFPVTISIGLAQGDASDGLDSLYARADRALYVAKTSGRNRVVMDDAAQVAEESSPWPIEDTAEIAWCDALETVAPISADTALADIATDLPEQRKAV